ncbi:MAG: bifunctional phosphoribosylaminoimidazolecarboxamide formyltransferase/IMP cyclohydrolase [Armatimonadetes bacterium]|nr:bifunctional phosphoribosylaminoimidazolecarboxamide formyltransferase/IMP cyclohydrolase [Armatimonadota bacterium]
MGRIQRAVISVSDKSGVVEFARGLAELGIEILSTGGTARTLEGAGVPVVPVEQVTGFPEMMEGRVKTLHPAIHGGILADRARPEHMEQLAGQGLQPVDLVAVNLYPFEATVARPDCTAAEAIENIDIGGPSMIRSAAKNHAAVTVVTTPADYPAVLAELREQGGATRPETRRRLARQAFAHTAAYDAAIAGYLGDQEDASAGPPEFLAFSLPRTQVLRYGENPHQRAAFYRDPLQREPSVATARQLHGKELSFINMLDMDAALELVKEFDRPACSIIKHTNPCGCAVGATLVEAYCLAREGELPPFNPPGSRFGGIIACNRPVDAETAREIIAPKSFYECIIAPGFSEEALELFRTRKIWGDNVRLMEVDPLPPCAARSAMARGRAGLDFQRVVGGVLVQERDLRDPEPAELRVVTERAPTAEEQADLLFAWKVVRHVKSNAVVLARGGQLIGAGGGQTNRARSSELAVQMAGCRAEGAVCASDAFFPMPDGPEALARAGVRAIIQPGGSRGDDETIAVCNREGVAMVFTGLRHFRH